MNTQAYEIVALFGRYILILICFSVFVLAIFEIRKEKLAKLSLNIACLFWKRKNLYLDLNEENSIGRSCRSDIIIKSPFLKKRHFNLYLDNEQWLVSPVKNAKVYINEYLVEDIVQIEDGDRLYFGHENMVFHIINAEDTEADA